MSESYITFTITGWAYWVVVILASLVAVNVVFSVIQLFLKAVVDVLRARGEKLKQEHIVLCEIRERELHEAAMAAAKEVVGGEV